MFTCNSRLAPAVLLCLVMAAACTGEAPAPYAAVTIDLGLAQVDDAPVYFVVGQSGVPGTDNQGHTSNAGFVVTDEGVVVFDALGTPALGYRLLQAIRSVTDKPVRKIVISHYHADHVYGLQAFVDHGGQPDVIAQQRSSAYSGGSTASQGEDAARRLAQRREALWPWVNDATRIVEPDIVFDEEYNFTLGGVGFEIRHMGPAHAPGDSVMLVREYGVLFSGDLVYKGRVPFLDSPSTDVFNWLSGLEWIAGLQPQPYIIPGHGEPADDTAASVVVTKEYIDYLIDSMRPAVADFVPFDEAYAAIDWSRYASMPAFAASNRGNAYRVYLELEARSFAR
ncbi:MAG: MBL fold metallo-hydrolase [Halobacteria archaeon]|nr:MBL fold metallo-hydrolase [Halobacteria archaeon]